MLTDGVTARSQVMRARQAELAERRTWRLRRMNGVPDAAPVADRGAIGWVLPAVVLALLVVFHRTFMTLVNIWETNPDYSHGYLVPLVSAFFAWRAWDRYGAPTRENVTTLEFLIGAVEVTGGLFMHGFGWFGNAPLLDVGALVVVLHGVVVMLGGVQASREYACAVLYLLFMAPLPVSFHQPMAIFMQQLVSWVSTHVLNLCGIEAWREGYIVRMGADFVMEVGAACSGLRQLTAFLALSVAAAHLSDRPRWYKWSLVMLSVPTAVGANCVRVILTGFIMVLLGPEWADGVLHTLEGLAVFIVGIGLFMVFAWALARFDHSAEREPAEEPEPAPARPSSRRVVAMAAQAVPDSSAEFVEPLWKARLQSRGRGGSF